MIEVPLHRLPSEQYSLFAEVSAPRFLNGGHTTPSRGPNSEFGCHAKQSVKLKLFGV